MFSLDSKIPRQVFTLYHTYFSFHSQHGVFLFSQLLTFFLCCLVFFLFLFYNKGRHPVHIGMPESLRFSLLYVTAFLSYRGTSYESISTEKKGLRADSRAA